MYDSTRGIRKICVGQLRSVKMHNIQISKTIPYIDSETFISLGANALLVLSYLEPMLTDEYKGIHLKTLTESLPFSHRSIQEYIYKLRDTGLIDVQNRNGYMNFYRRGPLLILFQNKAKP